jgi:hypothetical protein
MCPMAQPGCLRESRLIITRTQLQRLAIVFKSTGLPETTFWMIKPKKAVGSVSIQLVSTMSLREGEDEIQGKRDETPGSPVDTDSWNVLGTSTELWRSLETTTWGKPSPESS